MNEANFDVVDCCGVGKGYLNAVGTGSVVDDSDGACDGGFVDGGVDWVDACPHSEVEVVVGGLVRVEPETHYVGVDDVLPSGTTVSSCSYSVPTGGA